MIKPAADQVATGSQTGILLFFQPPLTYHIIAKGPRKKPHVTVTHTAIQAVFLFGLQVPPVLVINTCKFLSLAINNCSIRSSPQFSPLIGSAWLYWHYSVNAAIYQT